MQHPMIYHITTRREWEQAQTAGEYRASSLEEDGFIHASTREQVPETANLFFHGTTGLVLLCIDTSRLLPELRYELASGTGQEFPHIYGPLNLYAVVDEVEFAPDPVSGKFYLPDKLS